MSRNKLCVQPNEEEKRKNGKILSCNSESLEDCLSKFNAISKQKKAIMKPL